MRLDCQYNCDHEWVGCHERWAHTHAKICFEVVAQTEPTTQSNTVSEHRCQCKTAKQLVKNIFANFKKKKKKEGFVFKIHQGTTTRRAAAGFDLTCPSIGVPQIGVQQIDAQQIDVPMTVFLARYDQQRIWTICRISR